MADNERTPEKLIESPYVEKKCEREFRKLLQTSDTKSPYKDYEISPEKISESPYTEKKCEREFRKLLQSTDSRTANNDGESSTEILRESPHTEKKCEREFRKLLQTTNSRTVNKDSESSTEKLSDSPYTEKKCEREFRKLLQTADSKTANITYYNNENAIPEKRRKRSKGDEQDISDDSSSSSGITSFSHFQKCKALCCGESSEHLKSGYNLVLSPSTNEIMSDLQSLFENLKHNSLEKKCQSVISLAVHCSDNLSATELFSVLEALNVLTNPHKSDALAFCHALLLFTLTKKTLNLDQIVYLEESVLKLADSVIRSENSLGNIIGLRLALLRGVHYLKAYKLCQKLFAEKNLDIDAIDVLTLCCSSLRNLSTSEVGMKYRYKDSTLKFILGMTGKATQEIVAENLIETDDDYTFVSAPSHMVNQCLQILEHMLSVDPESPCKTLDHEDFSLLHCLTRLLGWCMSFLFQKEQSGIHILNTQNNSLSSFHLATLVSILKILSILSFNPDQYDSFTNIRGLMEKVMICILKAYFQSEENRFDVLVLALELMINFFLKNKRTFVLLCLKKFQINTCEQVLSIEALIKILENSLEKINEIKEKSLTTKNEENSNNDNEENTEDNLDLVLEAADEDMELSTIVSFISILLVFFMDTKRSFVDFIRERLSEEKSSEAIIVSKKVLQFASLTGGMPVTGILLLRHAIKKLSRLYPSGEAPTDAS